ncbi:MAG: hypothetical protein WC238_00800 [Parcubacteria group bacterium]|jgi:hypothetical protein
MLKISDSLKEIVEANSFFKFGLYNRLLNLSKLAAFVKPLIETRVKKEVGINAILMGLSRLQRENAQDIPKIEEFPIINLTVNSELCSINFFASSAVLENLNKVHAEIQKQKGYLTLSQGITEITMLINEGLIDTILNLMEEQPKSIKRGLSSLGLKFDAKYNDMPGFFYYVLQQVALQGISVYEISSTYTELILYIEEKDIKLAFDTLYNCFSKKDKASL